MVSLLGEGSGRGEGEVDEGPAREVKELLGEGFAREEKEFVEEDAV